MMTYIPPDTFRHQDQQFAVCIGQLKHLLCALIQKEQFSLKSSNFFRPGILNPDRRFHKANQEIWFTHILTLS
jgi:hypothetical protein